MLKTLGHLGKFLRSHPRQTLRQWENALLHERVSSMIRRPWRPSDLNRCPQEELRLVDSESAVIQKDAVAREMTALLRDVQVTTAQVKSCRKAEY
jgi:hypothetical protein